jgi:hypothetical protein
MHIIHSNTLGKYIRRDCEHWEATAYVTQLWLMGLARKVNVNFLQNVVTTLYHMTHTPEKQCQNKGSRNGMNEYKLSEC